MKIKIKDVEFDVEYKASGFGGDAELEEVVILVGGEEVSSVLSEKVLQEIDEKCMEDYWSSAPDGPEYEPEDDN